MNGCDQFAKQEYPGILKEVEQLRVDSWMIDRKKRNIVTKFSACGLKNYILLENSERVRRGRGSSKCRRGRGEGE